MTNRLNSDGIAEPHFVLVPVMAQGHMIPMVDMARLLAGRGALVTLITTPLNAARIDHTIRHSDLPIRFVSLRFPCAEAGLPDGCESIDALPSRDMLKNFDQACKMLREPLSAHLRAQSPAPSCVISDMYHPWTQDLAREFGIPRLTFNGTGCCAYLVRHLINHHRVLEGAADGDETLVIPGLPHPVIEITRDQAPGNFGGPRLEKTREEAMKADSEADGVVVNSYDDLEPSSYRERLETATGKKVWMIGPVSLRSDTSLADEDQSMRWLDSKKPGSVVYVSFGSLARAELSKLVEIGLGLEASGSPFIWVIKAGGGLPAVEEWLSGTGFEERVAGRGLVIKGWAPQVMVLSHPAVGGFMTHCGWNSTLEGVAAGVPMVTWPHFAEQFVNEKVIVDVLRIGVSVGVKAPARWGMEGGDVAPRREQLERAVRELMDEGEEGEERRARAREMGEKARMAMEVGGSSYNNLSMLIEHVQERVIHGGEEQMESWK